MRGLNYFSVYVSNLVEIMPSDDESFCLWLRCSHKFMNSGNAMGVFAEAFQPVGAFFCTQTYSKLLNSEADDQSAPRSIYLDMSSVAIFLN